MAKTSTNDKGYNVVVMTGIFLLGAFITFLNSTFMNVALPDIMKELNISVSTVQWLSTGYMLATGIIVPFSAFFIDKFTTKTLFLISMGLFTLGTIIGAIANDFTLLLTARIVQGLAGGLITALMQTVFMIIFPKEKRGFAMGIVGVVIAFAPAIGPTLSGWIVNNYPWRYLFYVTMPFGFIDLILGAFLLKSVTGGQDVSIDILSLVLSTVGFGALLYGFSNAGNASWLDASVYLPLIIGVVCIILFGLRQIKMEHPMLNLSVFKSKIFTFSTIIVMITYAALISSELIIPMYLENIRGLSALTSGLILMPGAIVMGIMNPVTGILFDKYGARALSITGLLILTIGTLGFCRLTTNTSNIYIIVVYAIRMFGISMITMPLTTSGLNTLERDLYSHGNAANSTLRQVAGSIGTSLIVTLMSKASANSGIANPIEANVHGMNVSFLVIAGVTIVGLIIAFLVVRKKEPVAS